MHIATRLQEPGNAFRLAMRAVCMSRIGWLTNNTDLVTHAKTNYVGALSEFQKALWDENESREDRTLAAGRALTLYELYEATSFKGWNSHSSGFASMLQMRRPDTLTSPLAKTLVESFRSTSMYQCIQRREGSFLLNAEWVASLHDPSNLMQELYNIGLDLAAFLGDLDRVEGSTSPLISITWQTLLTRLVSFDHKLEKFWARFIKEQDRLPIYWDSSAGRTYMDEGNTDHMGRLVPIEFHDVYTAHSAMTYWAIKGVVCGTLWAITRKASYSDMAWAMGTGKKGAAYEILRHYPDIERCRITSDSICRNLGLLIMRALPYCMRDEQGLVGPQRTLFAMRVALMGLRNQKAPELEECERLYAELTKTKGVGYAMHMKELPGTVWDDIEKARGSNNVQS